MRRDSRHQRSGYPALFAAVVAIALLLASTRLPLVVTGDPRSSPTVDAAWAETTERARTEGQAAFEIIVDEGTNPPGDTVFMRHRDLVADEDGIGARLALAALATTPAQRLAVLDELAAQSSDPRLTYRIALERARVVMRLGRTEEAAAIASTLTHDADLAPLLTVDALYVEAHAALALGDLVRAERLLRQAVEIDPAFFNARQTHIMVLATHLPTLTRDEAACLDGARQLVENSAALPSLAGSERRLLLDLADALSRHPGADHAARLFTAGVAFAMAGDEHRAQERLTRAVSGASGMLPPRCEAAIIRAAALHLAALERPS